AARGRRGENTSRTHIGGFGAGENGSKKIKSTGAGASGSRCENSPSSSFQPSHAPRSAIAEHASRNRSTKGKPSGSPSASLSGSRSISKLTSSSGPPQASAAQALAAAPSPTS